MLNRRTLARVLCVTLIAANLTVTTAPLAAAETLDPCELAQQTKAKSGNIGGRSSYSCPKRHRTTREEGHSDQLKTKKHRNARDGKDASLLAQWIALCETHRLEVGDSGDCAPPVKKRPARKTAKPKPPTESQLRQVTANLKLPNPTPRFGPDPSVNEWNMLAVGFPIWLWTDRPTQISTTAHHDGLTFTLTATWTSTTFTMGDGHTKTCAATTIRPKTVRPDTKPSPTCGYTYQTKSKIGHPYTVTADTHWQIDWTTNGYSGTFNHTYTGSRTLEIGELQSLING